jgi:hypothetical protein
MYIAYMSVRLLTFRNLIALSQLDLFVTRVFCDVALYVCRFSHLHLFRWLTILQVFIVRREAGPFLLLTTLGRFLPTLKLAVYDRSIWRHVGIRIRGEIPLYTDVGGRLDVRDVDG